MLHLRVIPLAGRGSLWYSVIGPGLLTSEVIPDISGGCAGGHI